MPYNIILYFLHSTSVLSFYMDVVLTLSTELATSNHDSGKITLAVKWLWDGLMITMTIIIMVSQHLCYWDSPQQLWFSKITLAIKMLYFLSNSANTVKLHIFSWLFAWHISPIVSCLPSDSHHASSPFDSLWPPDGSLKWDYLWVKALDPIQVHHEHMGKSCMLLLQNNHTHYPLLFHTHRFTHWARVMHICISKLTVIGSDNGLAPAPCRAIIWANAGILLIWNLGTNFSEISSKIHILSFIKCIWKCRLRNYSNFVSASMCSN